MHELNIAEQVAWRNKVHALDASLRTLRETPAEARALPHFSWRARSLKVESLSSVFQATNSFMGSSVAGDWASLNAA